MTLKVPDWLLQISNTDPNLVEDSPTFRAVEQTQQKKNLVKATKTALSQMEEKTKQTQLANIKQQVGLLKQLKDQTSALQKPEHPKEEKPPDNGEQVPPQEPGYTNPSASLLPDERQPGSRPGDVTDNEGADRSLESDNGIDQFPPNNGPAMSPPGGNQATDPAQYQDPNNPQAWMNAPQQQPSVQDVMEIAQATGLSPQKVASMVLLGQDIHKLQPPGLPSQPSPTIQPTAPQPVSQSMPPNLAGPPLA